LENNKLCFCGDSAAVDNQYNIVTRSDEKVFKIDNFLFGFASSFRMGQLLRFSFYPPPKPEGKHDYDYMCTDFINEVRKCFGQGGYSRIECNEEYGGNFIVGFNKVIYDIGPDFQVGVIKDPFWAIGSGGKFALGACYALNNASKKISLEEKLTLAMKAACEYSAAVREPFTCVGIDYSKNKSKTKTKKTKSKR
jgi:hypothetical protein